MKGARVLQIVFNSSAPAVAGASRHYGLLLPKDPAGDDDIQLVLQGGENFTARLDELVPGISGVLQMRIKMFVERVHRELLTELRAAAERALGKRK